MISSLKITGGNFMIIQHNLPALNAHRQLTTNNSAVAKSLEKLSSGYRINKAGDDAAGLAISEKMRGQISGLKQASRNSQDGISLIQTAEGALQETHSILQRMRELAVQSANGTYDDDVDRYNLNKEVDALKSEIDRIATSTNFNGINLLDGSLGGVGSKEGEYGPKFSSINTVANAFTIGSIITSDVSGVAINVITADDVVVGNESAVWNDDGTELTLNLKSATAYTQEQINTLIANAEQEESTATAKPGDITVILDGTFTSGAAGTATTTATAAGKRATDDSTALAAGHFIGANNMRITANKYGADLNASITFTFDAATAGAEGTLTTTQAYGVTAAGGFDAANFSISLLAGKEYTADDINAILKKNNLDYTAEFIGPDPAVEPETTMKVLDSSAEFELVAAGGTGVSSADPTKLFGGTGGASGAESTSALVFQIGANGTADQRVSLTVDDMSSTGIGINSISIATRDQANSAIATIDEAVNTVSSTRADLGALQNRLEHTINNLGVTKENLTASESRIRDVDMAEEMMTYTKNNILTQAAQAMLAQANTLPQGVLQLLG
jgi:flagellin